MRKQLIEHDDRVSIVRQCALLNINRSGLYYEPEEANNEDFIIVNEIREIHEEHTFLGYRKVHDKLCRRGYMHNIKKTQRLMQLIGLRAIYPQPKTSIRNHEHRVYKYLLKNLKIDHPNHVWATDITYIKLRHGFIYLVCIIDIFSRKIMGWFVSTFLDTPPCIEAYKMATKHYKPEILNSDQGCQFTSEMWVTQVEQDGIRISMDGKGRWADNIYIERFWRSLKYEAIFLNCLENVEQTKKVIADYIDFYNNERPHQALGYKTPNEAFNEGIRAVDNDSVLFDFPLNYDHLRVNNYAQTMGVKMGV